jgi:predicted porin
MRESIERTDRSNWLRARARRQAWLVVAGCASLGLARDAAAEVTLVNARGWELFTDGRLGGFANYTRGDAFPLSQVDGSGSVLQAPFGGGISANTDTNSIADPANPTEQRRLESMRVRSGFLSNIFGFGGRTALTPWTRVSGYLQFWANIESNGERKYVPMPVDVRQGYARVDGLWGSVTVGRQLTLFSRGAAEIDFLYGHGYGVGWPAAGVQSGTAAGHVGTGVLGPGFASGAIYFSPVLSGLQVNVGLFDPVSLQGAWDRTKLLRPESEITYDRAIGAKARLHLFVNGGYQKVYRINEPDSTSSSAYGVGYGLRAEMGGVHLGLAGHYGQGLGLSYALETTEAAYDSSALHRLRKSDGYYAQAQYALWRFDFNAGVGISRVKPLGAEIQVINGVPVMVPADGERSATGTRQSLIRYQLGISAAVVYHVNQTLHLDVDYFRASFRWQFGEKEDVNFVSAGMTLTW